MIAPDFREDASGEGQGDISLTLTIAPGDEVEQIFSPSHEVDVAFNNDGSATVDLSPSDTIPNRDYIGNEMEVFTAIHAHLGDARVFSFGVGAAVNRHLLEGMARWDAGRSHTSASPRPFSTACRSFASCSAGPR